MVSDKSLTPEVIPPRRQAGPNVHKVGPVKVEVEPPRELTLNFNPRAIITLMATLLTVVFVGKTAVILLSNDFLTVLVVVIAALILGYVAIGKQSWQFLQWKTGVEDRRLDKVHAHLETMARIPTIEVIREEADRLIRVSNQTTEDELRKIHALQPYEVEKLRERTKGEVAKERIRLQFSFEQTQDENIKKDLDEHTKLMDYMQKAEVLIAKDDRGNNRYDAAGAPIFNNPADKRRHDQFVATVKAIWDKKYGF